MNLTRLTQLVLAICALGTATTARSDSQCMSTDLTTRAAAADWSIPPASCISSTTPITPAPAARPMLVTREKMMASGNAPYRSPSHLHPAGGDPVLGDGEFFEQRVDAALAGNGPHYEFKRTYRSRVTFKGALGHSWDHSYDKRLLGVYGSSGTREWISPACDDSLDFQDGELNVMHFTRDPASLFQHPLWRAHGTGLTIDQYPTSNGAIQWQMHDPDGNTLVFDTAGYLARLADAAGNALTFDWEPSGETLADAAVYGPPKRLARVHDGVRTVNYVYGANAALQCISLGTSCGDGSTRPSDVLAYFAYTPSVELTAVYHGQATTGERMVYRSSQQPIFLLSYYPPDCLPNATLQQHCDHLCGAVDPNNVSTCGNLDAGTVYRNYCTKVSCDFKDPATTVVTSPNQILCTKAISADPDSLCMSAYGVWPDCMQTCLTKHQCIMSWGFPVQAFHSFGGYDDLAHNIVDIFDERDKLEVHNTYGETPWDVSFDRVVAQQLGGATDENTTVTFAYHDLAIEGGNVPMNPPAGIGRYPGPYSTPDPANVVPSAVYAEGTVCPRLPTCTNAPDGTCSIASYYAPLPYAVQGVKPPVPTNAVVITDVHGVVRTQYYDDDSNLIREVNDSARESQDFNYDTNGYLVGVHEPSGIRQCFERDVNGLTTQTTTLPAPGYGGVQIAMVTASRYDGANQLTDVWRDIFGTVSKTHLSRDAHERVAYEEHDVKAGQPPLRTTYSYDEDPPPIGVRETPATETLPDGRVNTYRQIDPSLGGPRTITLDVNGALPQQRYARYDARGRLVENGETDRFAVRYIFDSSNRLQTVGHRDSASAPWIDTTYSYYDSPGTAPTVISETRRKVVYGYLGQFANTVTRASAGGASQTSCKHYSADGRLEAEIFPEGNQQQYNYDVTGRLTSVLKGFSLPATQQWARACAVRTPPPGDPGMLSLTARSYRTGGFITGETQGSVSRVITTDGFGRVIQTDGASTLPVASRQIGYDLRGRVVWTAAVAPQTPYGKPTMTTPGLLSMTEYDYDLADRVTAERYWHVETGEILTVTHDTDDLRRTATTTDRGVVSSTTFDGLGRLVSGVAADGSKTTVAHYLGYDVVTTETNQGTSLVRTIQYDTRGRVTNVLDENNVLLSSTGYDDDGHAVTESSRGSGSVQRWFDDFGRLVRVRKDLLTGGAIETNSSWDDNGRVKSYTDGAGNSWSMTYTGFDAPLTTTDPLGRVDTTSYLRGYSHPVGHVDAVGRHSCYRYDYEMRLQYVYDVDCPAGEEAPYGAMTPMMERRLFDYSLSGQLHRTVTWSDRAHSTSEISYSYDSLGRQTDEAVGVNAPPLNFYQLHKDYPNFGRTVVTQLSGEGYTPPVVDHPPPVCPGEICPPPPPPPPPPPTFFATFRQTFDGMGHLSSVDLNGARMATWNRSVGVGGPLSIVYADNTTNTYSYDARLRQTNMVVTQPQRSGGGLSRATGRLRPVGGGLSGGSGGCPPGAWCPPPMVNVTLASLQDAYGADSVVRMRQRILGGGAPITDVYQMDGDARLTAETLALPGVTMPAGEVDEATVSQYLGKGQSWRYVDVDSNGNWRSTVAPPSGASVPQHNDALGRLQAIDTTAMSADSHGNLINLAGDPLTFGYDDRSGLMISASNDGTAYTYSYDAADRRVIESSGSSKSVVLWDGARIVAHGDPAALVIDVPGADVDEHVASVDNGGTGAARFYHQGPDRSMLAVTDTNGLIEGYSYSAYGEATIWSQSGAPTTASLVNNRFGFQGQWLDPGTGTYAMRARQYVPRWGRFTSPDPLALAGGPSLYAFTGSRPVALRDPSGLAPIGEHGRFDVKWIALPMFGTYDMANSNDPGGFNATGGYGNDYVGVISSIPADWISAGWKTGDLWALVGETSGYQDHMNGTPLEWKYTDPAHRANMSDLFPDPFMLRWASNPSNPLGLDIVDGDTLRANALKAGLLRVPLALLSLACATCSAKNDAMIAGLVGPFVPQQAHAVEQAVVAMAMMLGPVLAAEVGGLVMEEAAVATRGVGQYGGIFSVETNAAGGEVWTSEGLISQNDFASMVNSGVMKGTEVNIITGVHGAIDGSIRVDLSMLADDVAAFGDLPGVTVHNFSDVVANGQIGSILNGEGTIIGGFCNSGVCLAPFK